MLIETVTRDDISVGVAAEDWRDAISKSAQTLLQKGAITQGYIDAMIESVEKNGPYIVIAKNIALAHARPECGVNEIGLTFSLLKPPINFGAVEMDPVKLLITLAAVDSDSHVDLLTELAGILSDPDRLNALMSAQTSDVFLEELTK